MKNNTDHEKMFLEMYSTLNKEEKKEMDKIMLQLSKNISQYHNNDNEEISFEEDIKTFIGLDMDSAEKLMSLEEENALEAINRLLWSDEKIPCLACGKENYLRVDAEYEGKLKYYTFMCLNCHDLIELGLNKKTNMVEDIR